MNQKLYKTDKILLHPYKTDKQNKYVTQYKKTRTQNKMLLNNQMMTQ